MKSATYGIPEGQLYLPILAAPQDGCTTGKADTRRQQLDMASVSYTAQSAHNLRCLGSGSHEPLLHAISLGRCRTIDLASNATPESYLTLPFCPVPAFGIVPGT